MKKTLAISMLMLCLFALTSCFYVSSPDGGFAGLGNVKRVTFVIDGVETTKTYTGNITYPEVPEKDNYIFSGWYYDEAGTKPAYLGSSNSSDLKLYAFWIYDYESALEKIFSEHIKAAVGIKVVHKNSGFLSLTAQNVVGSGIIFDEDENYYYILTNNHVTKEVSGKTREITAIDCYGAEHTAVFIAADASSDLSMLKIAKGESRLAFLEFAEANSKIGETVIAIGQPNGIDNSVTFGEMTKFDVLSGDDPDGNLGFEVVWHDAQMDHGSSGGVLLNGDFEIVGINYAIGTSKEDGKFMCGLAVPLDRVKAFVHSYKIK